MTTASVPGSISLLALTAAASWPSASSLITQSGYAGRGRNPLFRRLPGPNDEQLHRLGETLQLDLADRVEHQVGGAADRVRDRGRHHHLAPQGPGDDPVGEVDLGA